MNVLAIDASTDILSVALMKDSGWAEASLDLGLRHAERIMELADSCLARSLTLRSELGLVACARGPGSFTGLRIGMAASKGIAAGLAIPWISVPTLDALAWGYDCFDGAVAPIIDGRKGRIYSAVYLHGRKATDWLDIPLDKLAALLDTILGPWRPARTRSCFADTPWNAAVSWWTNGRGRPPRAPSPCWDSAHSGREGRGRPMRAPSI